MFTASFYSADYLHLEYGRFVVMNL